ncbi:MAG TPA: inorganic diphosphatase [Acidobacteriaceae bacterium]|nr:inorganic diphosphatase [Acidobacteriaceae bacterium]
MSNAKWLPLSQLPTMDEVSGDVTAVIETPKGSPNKYDYDDGCRAFRLAGVMPEGTTFPYDFGFIPSTVADDGDPLDVLVFLDAPVVVGCVLTVRLIGVIEAKQRKQGEQWIRNDRLLAVATHAHTHQHVETVDSLRPHLVDEIEDFFRHYNEMKGVEFKPVDRSGPKKARKLLGQAEAAFRARQPQGKDDQ